MKIEGILDRIIFRNEENGYTVAQFLAEDGDITVVGSHMSLFEKENLRLEGELIYHPKYGEQFQFSAVEKIRPRGEKAIVAYLSGGLIPHVGKVTAKRIVDTFGEETMRIIEEDPVRLGEVEGIGKKKLAVIVDSLESQKGMREFLLDAQEFELPNARAMAIYKVFGDASSDILRRDPYRLADTVRGIGFQIADAVAQKSGIPKDDEARVIAGMKYVLNAAVSDGHCFLPKEKLLAASQTLLDLDMDFLDEHIVKLAVDPAIYVREVEGTLRIYLLPYYRAEDVVAEEIARRGKVDLPAHMAEDVIAAVLAKSPADLAERQKEALARAIDSNLLIITGGPGTGKTTTLRAIVDAMERLRLSVALAAPTGRAAKRMEEATGRSASTIHRLLSYDYISEDGTESRVSGDEVDADVVIVDEASMIDLLLMRDLLTSLKEDTRLILVGDVDQLPSVGAGNVLRDLIASKAVEAVHLDKVFRQAETSAIVKNAHRINRGEYPVVNAPGTDFFFMETPDPEAALALVASLVKERLPNFYGIDPVEDIQVLAPMKKGVCGVENLNLTLQAALNPGPGGLSRGGFTYKVGDKVMQTKNNYEMEWKSKSRVFDSKGKGVFNGDLGTVGFVDRESETLKVAFDDKVCTYEREHLNELAPAYAATIHKSQGSEFPVVVLPVVSGPPMFLTRNLLYTAITRAKKLVVVVGNRATLRHMVENNRIEDRYSALDARIKERIDGSQKTLL
ncbi:SF1B family DNA helicase RecD2 [Aedoeadaptatus ivorii]|uniref:SF1B family DNA helicase RecD2 n=1 Tax=Aedoeadaptatus ivorii TaxID=54006 RepID=UPI0027D866FC|nr:ATP-dependent RecD-like DNA helicase [Peptoniphilus ivorii]